MSSSGERNSDNSSSSTGNNKSSREKDSNHQRQARPGLGVVPRSGPKQSFGRTQAMGDWEGGQGRVGAGSASGTV